MTIADVGAGGGAMTVVLARLMAPPPADREGHWWLIGQSVVF
jgi:hypothetical protein